MYAECSATKYLPFANTSIGDYVKSHISIHKITGHKLHKAPIVNLLCLLFLIILILCVGCVGLMRTASTHTVVTGNTRLTSIACGLTVATASVTRHALCSTLHAMRGLIHSWVEIFNSFGPMCHVVGQSVYILPH